MTRPRMTGALSDWAAAVIVAAWGITWLPGPFPWVAAIVWTGAVALVAVPWLLRRDLRRREREISRNV